MNIFEYANYCENVFRANLYGYEPKTTFMSDFSIAEAFGADEVKDTYNRAFNEWKTDVEYYTEFVMVLNHKIFMQYEWARQAEGRGDTTTKNHHDELGRLYDELWRKADAYGMKHFKGEELDYYYRTLD